MYNGILFITMLVIFNCTDAHNITPIIWFKREGWWNTTAMHFLVWTWFMCPWARLLPHLICTVSEHTLTMPETTFSSRLWHGWWTVPSHGTLVLTLIKWTGLWSQPCPGSFCQNTPELFQCILQVRSTLVLFSSSLFNLCLNSLSSFTCRFSKMF